MVKFWKIFLIIAAFLIAAPIFAIENGDELSLEECIEIALQNDPNMKISTSYDEIDISRINQAKSEYFPTLGAGAGYNFQNTSTNNTNYANGTNANNYGQINVGVNQLIWNFGKTRARINMEKYNLKADEFENDNMILSIVHRVKSAYFTALAASANEDVYERSVRINELHYERAKALFEEGLISKIDVVNAEVYLTDAKIQLISAQNKYNTAIIALNNAMFLIDAPKYTIKNTESFNFQRTKDAPHKNFQEVSYKRTADDEQTAILTSGIEKHDILQNFVFTPWDTSLEAAIKIAIENRPDLKSLRMVQGASEEALKAVKRTFMPDLGATGGYNYRNFEGGGTTNSLSAGINLNFDSNLLITKYRVNEAKSYLDIAMTNVDLLEKNIYFEVQKNYSDMIELEKRVPLMRQKVAQTLENFELADGRYTVGLGNFIELQDAQTNYNNAQLAYVQAVFDYNFAKTLLERSMGVK